MVHVKNVIKNFNFECFTNITNCFTVASLNFHRVIAPEVSERKNT